MATPLGPLLAPGVDLHLWTFGAVFLGLHLEAWSWACGREDADALTSGSRWANRPALPVRAEVPVARVPSFQSKDGHHGGRDTQSPLGGSAFSLKRESFLSVRALLGL